MISKLKQEFKNIVWPKKEKVKEDFGIVLVIATILSAIVLLMDNGTQFVFEKIMTFFL